MRVRGVAERVEQAKEWMREGAPALDAASQMPEEFGWIRWGNLLHPMIGRTGTTGRTGPTTKDAASRPFPSVLVSGGSFRLSRARTGGFRLDV